MMQKRLWNKSAFNLFLFTPRKNLGISLISSAIVLVFSPFLILQTINNYLAYEFNYYYPFKDIYEAGAPLMAFAAAGIFVLLLFINFSYLYNKSASDTFHSMPIKRRELLLSRFFGAYVSALIPLTVGYIGFAAVLAKSEVVGSFRTILTGFLYTALAMFF
ncbi:MAG: hypothetical protein KBS52_00225, partial [Clostridiales bacterium]|nr:hypothetical protein [Candidatus Equinaster intestinalis]